MLIVVGVLLCLFYLGCLGIIGWELVADHTYRYQGVWYGTPPNIPEAAVSPFAVNASLERYEGQDLDRALTMIRDGGYRWVRQRFPWSEIEAEQGEYDWEKWDRIVDASLQHGLNVIAVLETSPSWARAPIDMETPEAPPRDFPLFADFATAFAARYREQMNYYEIWDQPNLYPYWGERYTDPTAYTHLLQAGYAAIKEGDPEALVLTAGLAPNVEEGGQYMSDILFLQGMYEAGAKGYFDILAVKPYGLWYEPDDRRLSHLETNFSRPILLRDVMDRHGDGDKAVWAVEFGWCALPPSWTGRPAPWTSDTEEKQARRTVEAIERARNEWPWMGVMALQHFHPLAAPDDPIEGFSLITDDFEPRLTYLEVQELARNTSAAYVGWYPASTWAARYDGSWREQGDLMVAGQNSDEVVLPFKGTRLDILARPPLHLSEVTIDGQRACALPDGTVRMDEGLGERRVTLAKGLADEGHVAHLTAGGGAPPGGGIAGFIVMREASFGPYYLSLLLLTGAGLIVVWRLGRLLLLARSLAWWRALGGAYLSLRGWQQLLTMALALGIYYFSPWTVLSLVGLVALVPLLYLRLDLGLALAVFCIPFFLRAKILLGQSLSLVEMLTLLCFCAWLLKEAVKRSSRSGQEGEDPLSLFPSHPFTSLRQLLWGIWDLIVHLVRSASSLDFAILLFLAVSIFSLTISENFGVSFYELRTVVVGPAILYLLIREASLDEDGLLRLVDALVLAAVVVSLYGLYQYSFTADVITAEGVRRIRGVYGSPNNLGLFLGRIVPLTVALVFFGRSWRRWGYLWASVPILLCLYLTHSRGAWLLGVPAALLFMGLMRGRRALAAAALAVVAGFLALLPVAKLERITSLFDLAGGTTFLRLKLWEATLAMIRDHPLFGVGLDNFLYQYPRYMLPEAWQEPDLSHPHNILLDWWTRLGVMGVAALIWLQVAFFHLGVRLYRSLEEGGLRALVLGLMASMVTFLAHGLIDNSYFLVDLAFVFFLTLGIVRRLSCLTHESIAAISE